MIRKQASMTVDGFSPEQIETIDLAMSNSLQMLRRAESVIAALVDVGAISHAGLYAQAAAHRACYAHTGTFASPAIEVALARASSHLDAPSDTHESTGETRRVLHIATQLAYPEGGHTRLLLQWIRADSRSTHSLVVTMPRYDIPSPIVDAVAEQNGQTYRPAVGSSSFVERARHLRQIASGFDIIVLHTHPFDPLPLLALSWPNRPPTILMNHAPHLFWLGRSLSDVVTYGRDAAQEICVTRRSINPEATFYLPVTVESEDSETSASEEVRRELAVQPEDLLLLTVASDYKLQKVAARDLIETVVKALSAQSNVVWRAVGPGPEGRWADIAAQTGGRVRAVGVRDDRGLYAAADAFMDSYPFAARTAMFRAASAGIPILAPRWHPPSAEILSSWGSAVDAAIIGFADEESLARALKALGSNRKRRQLGRRAKESVLNSAAEPWANRLYNLYAFAAERKSLRDESGLAVHPASQQTAPNDLDRYLRNLYSVTESQRVLLGWHRIETNFGAEVTFPAEEASLADGAGLAAFIGEQSLTIRDHEARIAELEHILTTQSQRIMIDPNMGRGRDSD